MAEEMNELQLLFQENQNTGTAWTRNDSFEKNGYLVVKDLWDAVGANNVMWNLLPVVLQERD